MRGVGPGSGGRSGARATAADSGPSVVRRYIVSTCSSPPLVSCGRPHVASPRVQQSHGTRRSMSRVAARRACLAQTVEWQLSFTLSIRLHVGRRKPATAYGFEKGRRHHRADLLVIVLDGHTAGALRLDIGQQRRATARRSSPWSRRYTPRGARASMQFYELASTD